MFRRQRSTSKTRTLRVQSLESRIVLACLGDFDGSNTNNAADINELSQAVRAGNQDPEYDLDENGVVDQEDRHAWLDCAGTTYGDSDLSGRATSHDYHAWNIGLYERQMEADWEDGDFDGDHDFDRYDVVAALQTGLFNTESVLTFPPPRPDATPHPILPNGALRDGRVSLEYIADTGTLHLRSDDVLVVALAIDSAGSHLGTITPDDPDFRYTTGTGSFLIKERAGREIFLSVDMTAGLSEEQVLNDLTVVGAFCSLDSDLCGGGVLNDVDLIYREKTVVDLTNDTYHADQLVEEEHNFEWRADKRGRLSVGLFFDQADMDAELELYRDGKLIKWSTTTRRAESIEYEVVPHEVYEIRVSRITPQTRGGDYELSVHLLPEDPRVYVLTSDHVQVHNPINLASENTRFDLNVTARDRANDIEIGPTGLIYVSLDRLALLGVWRPFRLLEFVPDDPDAEPRVIPLPLEAGTDVGFDVLEDGTFIIPAAADQHRILRFDRQGNLINSPQPLSTGNAVPHDVTVTRSGEVVWTVTTSRGLYHEAYVSPAFDGGTWQYSQFVNWNCEGRCTRAQLKKEGSNSDREINFSSYQHIRDLQETMDGTLFYVQEDRLTRTGFRGTSRSISNGRSLAVSHGEFDVPVPSSLSLPHEFSFFSDRDGDGLLDRWEDLEGIDLDGDNLPEIPLPGADPDHKDIYVEIDWLTGRAPAPSNYCQEVQCNFTPTNTILDRVVKAFADVPADLVYNPNGEGGINLHLDLGTEPNSIPWQINSPEGIFDLTEFPKETDDKFRPAWEVFRQVKQQYAGTPSERNSNNAEELAAHREMAYRYALFGNRLGSTGIAGMSDQPGRNLMVSLGGWSVPGGTAEQQAVVFMHELGHSLGLGHGGDDDINFKPNYLSVMNYSHAYGLRLNGELFLDYSRYVSDLPGYRYSNHSLDELRLNEQTGVGFPDSVSFPFYYQSHNASTFSGSQPIDWNQDGSQSTQVEWDVNNYRRGELLKSYSDWGNLQLGVSTVHDTSPFFDGADGQLTSCTGIDGASQQGLWECNDSINDPTDVVDKVGDGENSPSIDARPTFDDPNSTTIDEDWFEFTFDVSGFVEVVIMSAVDIAATFYNEDGNQLEPDSVVETSVAAANQKESEYRFQFDAGNSANTIRFMQITSTSPRHQFEPSGYTLQITSPMPAEDFTWTGEDCSVVAGCDWHDPGNWSADGKPAATAPTHGENVHLPNLPERFEINLDGEEIVLGDISVGGNYELYNGSLEIVDNEIEVATGGSLELDLALINSEILHQTGGGQVEMNGSSGPWLVSEAGTLSGVGRLESLVVGRQGTFAPGPVNGPSNDETERMTIGGDMTVLGTIQLHLDIHGQGDFISRFEARGNLTLGQSQLTTIVTRTLSAVGLQSIEFLTIDPDRQRIIGLPTVIPEQIRGVELEDVRLVGDAVTLYYYLAVPGDSNVDKEFNSSDLIAAFSGGQFESRSGEFVSWEKGDWNGDGLFNTGDLIAAFAAGVYDQGPVQAVALVFERDEEEFEFRCDEEELLEGADWSKSER